MKIHKRTIVIGILSVVVALLAIAVYVKLTFNVDVTPFTQVLNDIQKYVPANRIDALVREARGG